MIVLACGGRDYTDEANVYRVLDAVHDERWIDLLIHGNARGADKIAGAWAHERGVQEVRCPANWEYHQNGAGPIRNDKMLMLRPDLVVAFPGGSGTRHMVAAAQRCDIDCLNGGAVE